MQAGVDTYEDAALPRQTEVEAELRRLSVRVGRAGIASDATTDDDEDNDNDDDNNNAGDAEEDTDQGGYAATRWRGAESDAVRRERGAIMAMGCKKPALKAAVALLVRLSFRAAMSWN